MFQPFNDGDYLDGDHLLNFEMSLAAVMSLLFIEVQWNVIVREI